MALACSEESEKLARKLKADALLANNLHGQGLTLIDLAGAAETEEARADHRIGAAERFRQSLTIKRSIGNEAGAADSLGELGKLLMFA